MLSKGWASSWTKVSFVSTVEMVAMVGLDKEHRISVNGTTCGAGVALILCIHTCTVYIGPSLRLP